MLLLAYEFFDDVAFFYLALAIVAAATLPWSAVKLGRCIWSAVQKPQLIPLTRIQKLRLQQQQQKQGQQGVNGAQSGSGGAVTVQPAGSRASASTSSSSSDAQTPQASSATLAAASGLTQESLQPAKPWLSAGNIVLACLWLIFLLMLAQIPSMQHSQLTSFQPYEVLGLDAKANPTDEEIKRAYRKQSLKFHPDRNPSPEAAQQFILIAKAYETLTSETAKANIEKYGNPDGYQGVSVTIGLPSILTKKENQTRVLVVYFLLFMVLPPIVVWVWWRKAKEYVDGGVLKRTIGLWYQLMLPNMGSKFLVEFFSIAGEHEVLLGPQFPTDVNAFKKLALEVKPHMVKQRFQDTKTYGNYFQYSHKASVILHAYLLRLPIPDSMQSDLRFLLKDAHRLLNFMLELSVARGFLRTVFGIFDLMQQLSQGMFAHDSPLLQLPHMTGEYARRLGAKKNIKTIRQFLKSPLDRLQKCIPELSQQQWKEMREVAELIPDVEMEHHYEVEDEEGLYEGDLVTLHVKLDRESFDPDKPDQPEAAYRLSQFDGDESTTITPDETNSPNNKEGNNGNSASQKGKGKSKQASGDDKKEDGTPAAVEMTTMKSTSDDADKSNTDESAASSSSSSSSTTPSSPDSRDLTDDEILDSLPIPKKVEKLPDLTASGPSVHSLTFPFPKHERWYLLLIQKSTKKADRIIAMQKVPSFFDEHQTDIKFYAPRAKTAKEDGLKAGDESAGVYTYELHAICDSYIGVDVKKTFQMKVDKPKTSAEEAAKKVAEKVQEEYAELADEEAGYEDEEYIGYWYYLGFASFWELALNVFVLGLLCVFIFNFLVSRGYWQRYIQPTLDVCMAFTRPLFDVAYPVMAPVLDPLMTAALATYTTIGNMLHRDPFPKQHNTTEEQEMDEANIPGMGEEEEE